MAPYVFRWSSDSIYVPCISDFNLDSFWCKQDTTIRCLLKKKKVWFAVVVLRVHSFFICHLDVEFYLHSTTYLPPPPSHTTHSVGSTGLALWVYAVCGVWGGWVGSSRWGTRPSLRVCCNFRYTRCFGYFAVSCDLSFSCIWIPIAVSCGETFRRTSYFMLCFPCHLRI